MVKDPFKGWGTVETFLHSLLTWEITRMQSKYSPNV